MSAAARQAAAHPTHTPMCERPQARRVQRVFRYSPLAVRRGLPAALAGCPYLCDPGRDRSVVNGYLEALWLGLWGQAVKRLDAAAEIARARFDGPSVRPHAASSVHRTALRLGRVYDWVETPEFHSGQVATGPDGALDLRKATEGDLDRLGRDMEGAGRFVTGDAAARPAYVAACQVSLLDLLEYLVHLGKRPPIVLTPRRRSPSIHPNHPIPPGHLVVRRASPALLTHVAAPDVDALVRSIPQASYRLGMRLACSAGLRSCEVLGMRDADAGLRTASGPGATMRVLGKGGAWRTIPVDDELLAEIEAYRAGPRAAAVAARRDGADPVELLLDDRDGMPLRYHRLHSSCVEAGERIGLPHRFTPHLGRHHYAVEYLRRDWRLVTAAATDGGETRIGMLVAALTTLMQAPLEALRRNLGHVREETTRRYLATLGSVVRSEVTGRHERRIAGGQQ